MKRRKLLKNKTASYIAVSILTLALAGITCGTFAWFNYDTRAPISELNGTSIGLNELQMGFISEHHLFDYEEYGLTRDDSDPNETIYWFSGHKIGPETINYILGSNGYATDTLYPVTSQKYTNGDDLELYSAPYIFHDICDIANKEEQIRLSLVFRYEDILADEPTYLPNENIYLSQFKLNTLNEDTFVHRAVRIYTNDKNNTAHLINPSSNEDGETYVGGILDLNKDGYYDCDIVEGKRVEHIYGQTAEFSHKGNPESEDSEVPEESRNSFVARHKAGTYAVNSYTPEKAEFEGFYEFRNHHKCVSTTNPDTKNYAYLDLSIFVEGWDLNVIDSQIGMQFSIELMFDTQI